MNSVRIIVLNKENIALHLSGILEIEKMNYDLLGETYSIEKWDSSNFTKDIEGKWDYSFLALINKEVVGFIIASSSKNDNIHINRIAINPETKRRGIGNKLLDHLIKKVDRSDIKYVTLFVNIVNVDAIKFYEYTGFQRLIGENLLRFLNCKRRSDDYREFYVQDSSKIKYYVYYYNIV